MIMIMLIFSTCSCGTKENEYKSEARFFYDQVDLLFKDASVDAEIEQIEFKDMQLFSKTIYEAQVRAICLNELISLSSKMEDVENSYECLQILYLDNKDNQEIKTLTDSIYADYRKIVEMLEESDGDSIKEYYQSQISEIQSQNTVLYEYVKNEAGVSHKEVLEEKKKIDNKYVDELENLETLSLENEKGSKDNPLNVGESIEISFIDTGSGRKGDSWYVASCIFTYKGKENNVANLNFELVDQESEAGVTLGKYGRGFVFKLIDENLSEDFSIYEGVYRTADKNLLIAVNEGGNVDFSVELKDNTAYLTIHYVEVTEDNLKVKNMISATGKKVWIKLD